MILSTQIKEGLLFQSSIIPIRQDNISYLVKSRESISLTYIFSGRDCDLITEYSDFSHEIQITFHKNFLQNFSDEMDVNILHQFPLKQQHEICCTSQMLLHDIIHCTLSGTFKKMFLESKAILLLLCFQKCNTKLEQDCSSCKFLTKPVEKEKILKAKEIIMNNLSNAPTIHWLSMQIGINQCYLKKGFKEIFGSTVYDFIQEQRMLRAKLLLQTSNYSVSQVAEQIGFSSQSNFSTAFKKFTGVFPSEFQQN